MPTENKRVNLTIPEDVYKRITNFRKKNSIPSDAGACLQLIQRQLDSIDQMEEMIQMVRQFTPEDLRRINDIGVNQLIGMINPDAGSTKE